MKTRCIISAPDKAELEKQINEYYASTSYYITEEMQVKSAKTGKILTGFIVKATKSRWQFRRIEEA